MALEVQVERLVHGRGFDEADARARIANQASRESRQTRRSPITTTRRDCSADVETGTAASADAQA